MTKTAISLYLLLISLLFHASPLIDVADYQLLMNDVEVSQTLSTPAQTATHIDSDQTELNSKQFALCAYPVEQSIIDELITYQQKVLVVLYEQQTLSLNIRQHQDYSRYLIQTFTTEQGPSSPV